MTDPYFIAAAVLAGAGVAFVVLGWALARSARDGDALLEQPGR